MLDTQDDIANRYFLNKEKMMNRTIKIDDDCCADELEEMIIEYIKAGFLSDHEISEICEGYIEDNYPDPCDHLTENDFLEVIKTFRQKFQHTGRQDNYLKLEFAFHALSKQGIVALHYAGYTQSDGFEDCNEVAAKLHDKGESVIGCCFYTEQDLGHILHEESSLLYLSFGNYFEKPTAAEVGKMIVDELTSHGFCVQWDGTAERKIAITNFKWDNHYTESGETGNENVCL